MSPLSWSCFNLEVLLCHAVSSLIWRWFSLEILSDAHAMGLPATRVIMSCTRLICGRTAIEHRCLVKEREGALGGS